MIVIIFIVTILGTFYRYPVVYKIVLQFLNYYILKSVTQKL